MAAAPATFGELLNQHRLRVGLTQDALAERAGISERAISDLERGQRRAPHADTIQRLGDALGLTDADRALLQAVAQRPRRSARMPQPTGEFAPKVPVFRPPALPTRTIGREAALTAVCTALREQTRLLTLTGPGGSGKTRLSIAAATELADEFEWGAVFVPLASTSDSRLVLNVIAESVGVHESPGTSLQAALLAFLRGKSLLLVLDNFEQVADAGPVVAELLDACPQLKVLVTSRASLRVRAEQEFPVLPLPVPDRLDLATIEKLARIPAVQLFIERTRPVRPGFTLSPANASAVAELCVRLEGLPLAIELAAARSQVLTPQAMLERLDHRLRLLVGGPADLPERHQTMRAAILWSHDLLTPGEQALFRRLAIFSGGCTLEAAEAVCNADSDLDIDVLDGLDALVGHSVLRQEEQPDGELRFRMLETIRELADERLRARGEAEAIAERHAEYYRDLAESVSPLLKGIERAATLHQLRSERDNFRQSLSWSIQCNQAETGLRLIAALDWWYRSDAPTEGQRWGQAVLELPDAAAPNRERAAVLSSVGAMLRLRGDYPAARRYLEESIAIWRERSDQLGLSHTLALLGWSLISDPAEATAVLNECIDLLRSVGTPWDMAFALLTQGMIEIARGDPSAAKSVLDECIRLEHLHQDAWLAAQALFCLGRLETAAGAFDSARGYYEASLEIFEQIGDKFYIGVVLLDLALTALLQRDLMRTVQLCARGLALSRAEGLLMGFAINVNLLAGVIFESGKASESARLFSAADAERVRLELDLGSFQHAYQGYIDAMRQALSELEFERAWNDGRQLPIEDAASEAIAVVGKLGLIEATAADHPRRALEPLFEHSRP